MEPVKKDEYDFTEEELKKIDELAELTEEELEKINDEVEYRWRQHSLDFNAYCQGLKFNPEECRNRLINKKKEEKMAYTRKRYWLDNKAPENIDSEGHAKQMDLFSLEAISKYLDRESLLTMLKVNKKVANVKDKMIVNNFEFKKVSDFEVFSGIRDYHTQANEESIRLLKEMVEGKDVPKPNQIIIEMKEDGELPKLPDTVELINKGMDYDSRTKLSNMINYDKSKFAITLEELDNENELGKWYSERAMILIPRRNRPYINLSTIDLHLCTNLTELGIIRDNGLGFLSTQGCFQFYSNLTEIVLPSSIVRIDQDAFDGCDRLVSINLPEQVEYLGNYCFSDCTSLSSIDLPSNITYIGSSCFSGCRSLRRISIPSRITELKKFTFSRCTSLSQVILPTRIKVLGMSCFEDCVMLSDITIPNSVIEIGTKCFFKCSSLNNLVVPDHVELGWDAIPNQREVERARGIQRNRGDSIFEITAGSPPNENGGFNGFGAGRRG